MTRAGRARRAGRAGPGGGPPGAELSTEVVHDRLRTAILRGEFDPTVPLSQVKLAARLGVSRTPVREAFLVLAIEGLLTLQAGRGARVRTYDAEEVRLVHDVRSLVEGRVARSAADHISNQQLAGLEECCARLEGLSLGAVRECNAENVRFHNALFAIVGSDRLMHIGRHLLEVPLPYKENYWGDPVQKRCPEVGHRQVLAALQSRDGEAAERAMREHVQETGAYIATWMAKQALAAD